MSGGVRKRKLRDAIQGGMAVLFSVFLCLSMVPVAAFAEPMGEEPLQSTEPRGTVGETPAQTSAPDTTVVPQTIGEATMGEEEVPTSDKSVENVPKASTTNQSGEGELGTQSLEATNPTVGQGTQSEGDLASGDGAASAGTESVTLATQATNPYSGGNASSMWTAWQLAYDRVGVALPNWGLDKTWYQKATAAGYPVGDVPRENAIAVWDGGTGLTDGHVAFVTQVNGGQMYVQEGNYNGAWHEGWVPTSGPEIPQYGNYYTGNLIGFIYLNNPPMSGKARVSVGSGPFVIRSAIGNLALDVAGASKENAANMQVWQRNDSGAQQFVISGNSGGYAVKNRSSGYVLDTWGGNVATNANVVQHADNGGKNQRWIFEDAGGGYVYIRNQLGYYLDVDDGKNANGTNVQVFSFNGTNPQKWKLEKPSLAYATMSGIAYQTHVQNDGWQQWRHDGDMSGTAARSLRLEGINIKLERQPCSGGIQYRTHVQNIGWQGWVADGAMSGTSGQSLRLEAIEIKLTGEMANRYDVYYRVHAQNIGWMSWAKNGGRAGSACHGYRLEAIQIVLVPKGNAAPGRTCKGITQTSDQSYVTHLVQYRTHVQNDGWQGFVYDGAVSGTSGRSLRLEGMNMSLPDAPYAGGIEYRTHVQNIGWQGWVANGAMSGTSGRSLRLEAMQVRLTGEMANRYDVWYRVHAQNFGWMGWAKNGASAGTAGYSYRLEAMQVKLVPKGSAAPGSTANAFREYVKSVDAVYQEVVRSLVGKTVYTKGVTYCYFDGYGDANPELICVTKESSGSGSTIRMYTYVSGAAKLLLEIGNYGASRYNFYKATNSLELYSAGHGHEDYTYYALRGGSYKKVASRARMSESAGNSYTGPWGYTSENGDGTAAFDRTVNSLRKGSCSTLLSSNGSPWKQY